jgi:hypothetical protein
VAKLKAWQKKWENCTFKETDLSKNEGAMYIGKE